MTDARKFVTVGLKVVMPLITLTAGVAIAQWLIATKPPPPQQTVKRIVPVVSAARVEKRSVCFPIRSQGTVLPRTESTLVARVSGRIVRVADTFDESGFFRKGDVLVEIDKRDYEVRIRRLEASLAAHRAQLAEAKKYLDRLAQLRGGSAVTEVEVDRSKAAYDVAESRQKELEAQLEEARNAESDTEIVAPFDGCIREKHADLGQFVTTGTPLATCFATDAVEVRLPVDGLEFAFLDLPLGETLDAGRGPDVVLETQFGGETCRWEGRIARSEAFVDARSRMVYLVAQVPRPYEKKSRNSGQPLAVGMFVQATIRSSPADDAVVLPEQCVDNQGSLFVIDAEGKLQPRDVQVLRRESGWVVVRGDLIDGQDVCATLPEHAVPGMEVQIVEHITPETSPGQRQRGAAGVVDLCDGISFEVNVDTGNEPADNAAGEGPIGSGLASRRVSRSVVED